MEKEKSLKERLEVALGKVATFLNKEEAEPIKLAAEVVKEDGTVVYTDADEFAPGVSVFVKEGEEVIPAPDGEHKLEDGSVVIVADGAVESIQEAETKEEMSGEGETPEFVTKAEFSTFVESLYEALNLSAEVAEESEKVKAKTAELETELSAVKEEKEALETKLKETPAAKTIKKEKTTKEVTKLSAKEWKDKPVKFRIKNPEMNPHNN